MSQDKDYTKEELLKKIQELEAKLASSNSESCDCISERLNNFEKTFCSTTDLIALFDNNFNLITANNSFLKEFGVNLEDIQGKFFTEALGTDFYNQIKDGARECLTGKQVSIEDWFNSKSNEKRFINITLYPNYDNNKIAQGFSLNIRDITEKWESSNKLTELIKLSEESKRKYKSLISKMMNAFALHELIYDENGKAINYRFLEVNPAWENILGVKSEDIVGKTLLDIMPNIEEFWINKYAKIVETDTSEEFEDYSEALNKHFYCYAYKTGSKQFAVIFNDITDKKLDEDNVRKLSTAVKQSPLSIVISDVKGIIEYVNPEFIKLTGYDSSFVIGKRTNVLKSGQQDADFYKRMWDTINSGKVWRGILHNRKKNGELYWESASISGIHNDNNEVVNFIKIGEDITKQKENEIKLKAALEKSLESDRLKSAFLANISHEIRTPMNGIMGFISLLSDASLTKEKIEKYSEMIHESGNRLLATMNNIIDIAKIEASQMAVTLSDVSVSELFDELYSFYSTQAILKGISFKYTIPEGKEDLRLSTDSNKLYGILSNLVTNAIKYTSKGEVTFGFSIEGDYIKFFVQDTGIGIPEERQSSIFNRFEQADIADKRVFQGAGLGLSISKAYAEMLGGSIYIKSQTKVGSKFTCAIPLVDYDNKKVISQNSPIEKHIIDLNNLKILIVEDDEISTQLLETMLLELTDNILFAKTGLEAVETSKEIDDIDIILMDIKLPQLNGNEATKEIRVFNKDVIIIAQTSYAMSSDIDKALESGCDDHISKPINKAKLMETIYKNIVKKNPDI